MRELFHISKKEKQNVSVNRTNGAAAAAASETSFPGNLHLLPTNNAETGLWQQAWEQVRKEIDWELPPSLQNIDRLSTVDEVNQVRQEALTRRNAQSENESRFFGGKYTYREVCDKVSNCAQKFDFVGDIVAQAELVYSALPWTAIRFIIQCAVGESETYHNILDGTEFVSELIIQYPAIEQVYAKINSQPSKTLRKSLLELYKLILQFQLYSIRYFDPHRKIARTFTGLNPVKADGIKSRLAAIDKAKQRADDDIALVDAEVTRIGIDNLKEGQAGQNEQLRSIQATLRVLSGESDFITKEQQTWMSEADVRQQKCNEALVDMWKGPIDDLRVKLEQDRIKEEREDLLKVRRWLSLATPEANHSEAKAKRPLLLGDWLIQCQVFQDWHTGLTSSFFWLYGFAGTGKTGLVCRVIDTVRDQLYGSTSDQEVGRLGYFYCSNDKANGGHHESSRADPEEALRSIVSQLSTSQRNRGVFAAVKQKFDTFGPESDRSRDLSSQECVEILVALNKSFRLFIILDAFDELDQRRSQQLIQNLKNLVEKAPGIVKIFISTRPIAAIKNDLEAGASMEVTAENNSGDVAFFIRDTLRINNQVLLNGKASDQLKSDIERTLTKRAQNMFLYASLLLSQICDNNKDNDEDSIRKKLETLPKNITEAYDQIMVEVHDDKNNSERSCRIAQETFKWLLQAQKPLRHDELLEAISLPERRVDSDELLHACRTLVNRSKTIFEFAHYSVREHLRRIEDYSASQCHIVATKSCLRILERIFGPDGVRDGVSVSERSFREYALLYWPLHYEGIHQEDLGLGEHRIEINAMLRTFLTQGRSKQNRYKYWFDQAHRVIKPTENKHLSAKFSALKSTPLSPLFAASVFGLDAIVSKFGRERDELNRCNTDGQTALCLAIEHNKMAVVRALVSSRFPAEVNLLNVKAVQQFEDFDGLNPPKPVLHASALQCAAATGRLEIAKYMIDQGANVDLVAGYYGSALQAAALNGHGSIVELLLRKGAEPNSQGGFYGNALQAASAKGYGDIINQLLEHRPPALVSAPGGRFGSALMAAICSASSETVFALLEENADPNMRSKRFGRPLEKSADMGYKCGDIVEDLLEFKAEADLSPKDNGEAHILHKAAMYNMPAYGHRFGEFAREMTPLAYACAEGHLPIVQMLLERGALIERDKDPSGVLEVVQYLIDSFKARYDAMATAEFINQTPFPECGHPIIFTAVSSGSAHTVSILLDSGATYRPNWFNATPLLATATFQCPGVAKLLLDYHRQGKIDVSINKVANNGRTALFEACELNKGFIVEQLLNAGADYTIADNHNVSLLHVSCHYDNIGVMSILVKKFQEQLNKADFEAFINRQANSGQTPLIHAAIGNRLAQVKMLLDLGADYTIHGHAGNTPLHFASKIGFDDIIIALLEKAKERTDWWPFHTVLNFQNKESKTPLMEAVLTGQLSTVRLLLQYGADPTIANDNKQTTLHVSSFRGQFDIFDTILKKAFQDLEPARFKAFLNARNKKGKTILMDAAETRRFNIMNILFDHGIDYTIPNNHNSTALHYAAWNGMPKVVELLLARASKDPDSVRFKSFLNYRNDQGKTALMDACETNRPLITTMLLDYGADFTLVDNCDYTALHYCVARNADGDEEVFVVFLRHSGR